MGPEFRRPGVHLWIPLGLSKTLYEPGNRFNESYEAVGLLRPGLSLEQAGAAIDLATQRVRQDPRTGRYATTSGWHMTAMPFVTFVVGDLRRPMLILMGAAVFVLLIACANTAGLTVAKASERSGELAVRAALGASRSRLVRLILVEGLVLGAAASLIGGALAFGGLRVVAAVAPVQIADGLNLRIDAPVMAFTALIGIAAGLLFAILAAWRVGGRTVPTLRATDRTQTANRSTVALRSMLVTAEVALALVLLVGASLFLRSLSRLQDVSIGFESRGLITGSIDLSSTYATAAQRAAFYRAVLDRARDSRCDDGGGRHSAAVLRTDGRVLPHRRASQRWRGGRAARRDSVDVTGLFRDARHPAEGRPHLHDARYTRRRPRGHCRRDSGASLLADREPDRKAHAPDDVARAVDDHCRRGRTCQGHALGGGEQHHRVLHATPAAAAVRGRDRRESGRGASDVEYGARTEQWRRSIPSSRSRR